LIFQSLFISK